VDPAGDGLLRGRLVHLLLEMLPRVPAKDRAALAERLLKGDLAHAPDLAGAFWSEAEKVLAHPALKDFFSTESRAEVAIVGYVAAESGIHSVSGRIDLLLRDLAGWHLVDFKTDRGVPAQPEKVDPTYVLQLALYRRLLMEMEPGANVAATLVYTAAPKVMPIPTDLMEQALMKLGVRANPVP
jgi:ATP-dependent helicase/nuclease subunit A